MTNVLDLFEGIGVIIDDALSAEESDQSDNIWKIKSSFEEAKIPLLTYTELPDENANHFTSLSFLVLDWDLYGLEPGVAIPAELTSDNIHFIKRLREIAFFPIFIFSNEDPNSIILTLEEFGVYDGKRSNNIFVKRKSEVDTAEKLFIEIESWTKNTPSIYVLKEWECSMKKAKNSLFWDFYNTTSNWPKVLQESFIADGVDKNHELNHIIFKNLIARTTPIEFDEDILANVQGNEEFTKIEIRKVLECERYVKNDHLPSIPAFGDVFKEENFDKGSPKFRYLINIRPDCDLLRQDDDVKLYCIKGRLFDETILNNEGSNKVEFINGTLIEKINNVFVPFVDGGQILEFQLKQLEVKKWKELKDKRIGRLLPPFITRLQQKYLFYLQRQGLPTIPSKAIET